MDNVLYEAEMFGGMFGTGFGLAGSCLGNIWVMFGICLCCGMCGGCSGHVWEMFGARLGTFW